MLANALAFAFCASVSVAAMLTYAFATARKANMTLLSVRTDAGALALLAAIPMPAVRAYTASSTHLATPPDIAVLADVLAATRSAVVSTQDVTKKYILWDGHVQALQDTAKEVRHVLLPSMHARGLATALRAM
jgi:hypothetical protein